MIHFGDNAMDNGGLIARHVSIRGVVQGVGFRPFVYRLATRHGVAGWVLNGEAGVEIHAETTADHLQEFLHELKAEPPPAAAITACEIEEVEPQGLANFEIRHSVRAAAPTVRISPDLAVCDACLLEMREPTDRRYRYPYINCTNCGPRYSIVRRLPYDRANTSMADWQLCEPCRLEYEDPLDRRYHAQPTACANCGPHYRLVEIPSVGRAASPSEFETDGLAARPTEVAAEMLRSGRIVGVKGIGGYHLACDATNAAAVAALRERKFRKEKPFALMVRTLDEARALVELTPEHERLLTDVARPIVIAPARVQLSGVAPDNLTLGVMLPYAPLHHLLFDAGAPSPLVLTSANRSNEPIAYRDEDAIERLSGIADALLIGERPIVRRVDDSIATIRRGEPCLLRRSRGYAPGAVAKIPTDEPILALGADLKNSIALAVRGEVFLSQFIGDLDHDDTRRALHETVDDLLAMYDLRPEELTVVHDLHPQFYSTRLAKSLPARRRVAVQHHQAHIASVLAEHGLFDEPVIGAALDGTGYGTDGTIWGCEFVLGSLRDGFERVASLRPVQMPGGDAAARYPVQAAAGFLAELTGLPDLSAPPFDFPARYKAACALVHKRLRCFPCSSAGRLFDAVAALCGFTREATFEGQAAIWLETLARQAAWQPAYPLPALDHEPLLRAIVADRLAGRPTAEIAAAFHAAVGDAIVEQIVVHAERHGLSTAVVSGGVFQNDLLLELIEEQLAASSTIPLLFNRAVPANDGGISLGQAALAALEFRL